jgi:peroxiredoxin
MRTLLRSLLACFVVSLTGLHTFAQPRTARVEKDSILGRHIPDFVLPNSSGKEVAFSDFNDAKSLVVVFLGTQCPIGNAYVPVLRNLQKQYADQGLQVVAINSNLADDAESVAKHVSDFKVSFPVLVDEQQIVADLFGARRTPEAFVLDRRRNIRYRGRIDDRIGYSHKREKARRSDVEEAVKELLAGKDVSVAETEPAGCIITRESRLKNLGEITFARHVSRILQKNCADCHHAGTAAPFSLLKYEDAKNWSGMIRETVVERRMPPWSADPRFGHWANDLRMSTEEIDTLVAWIDGGMPMGDPGNLPKPREYADGWQMGQPDIVFKIPREFTVQAQGTVKYQYFVTPTNFKEDVWVQASEARPGNWEAVHHIIVYVREKGSDRKRGLPAVAGFAPGEEPMLLPQGVGFKVPAGAELIWQLHYTPTGKVELDRSEVGLYFCKKPPQRAVKGGAAINVRFSIPPGAESHEVVAQAKISKDVELISFTPHMHLRGRDFKYTANYPDGREEVLLNVPNYDFNWQHRYRPATPLILPAGTTIHCVAHFDNSIHNPANPDPTKSVRWGDQSWEEMMIGFFSTVDALPNASNSKDLWDAVHAGSVQEVRDHLASGADINGRAPIGNSTPLVIASLYGHQDVAALLIEQGADLSIPSDNGASPLLIAAFFGHRDIVVQLLNKGADVNAKNKDGRTPLDTVSGAWGPGVEGVYKYFAGILQMELDLTRLKKARPEIAKLLREHGGKPASELADK